MGNMKCGCVMEWNGNRGRGGEGFVMKVFSDGQGREDMVD